MEIKDEITFTCKNPKIWQLKLGNICLKLFQKTIGKIALTNTEHNICSKCRLPIGENRIYRKGKSFIKWGCINCGHTSYEKREMIPERTFKKWKELK